MSDWLTTKRQGSYSDLNYNINDFAGQKARLADLHAAAKAVGVRRLIVQGVSKLVADMFVPFDLDYATYKLGRRIGRHRGLQNKWIPHQSSRECARRQRNDFVPLSIGLAGNRLPALENGDGRLDDFTDNLQGDSARITKGVGISEGAACRDIAEGGLSGDQFTTVDLPRVDGHNADDQQQT